MQICLFSRNVVSKTMKKTKVGDNFVNYFSWNDFYWWENIVPFTLFIDQARNTQHQGGDVGVFVGAKRDWYFFMLQWV